MNEEHVFEQAVKIADPVLRSQYIDSECAGSGSLKQSVERLVELHLGAGSFLERPAAEVPTAFRTDDTTDHDLETQRKTLDFIDFSDDESKKTLAHYEIHEMIGQGGMGVVLGAYDTKLRRSVAIKILSPSIASNAAARKRFLKEAYSAAAINHNHVVTIHAVDDEPIPYPRDGAGSWSHVGRRDL